MATKAPKFNLDFAALQEKVTSQFKGLNPNDPASWPAFPRYVICAVVLIGVLTLLWFVWLVNSQDELNVAQAKEVTLKASYSEKLAKAVNLEGLREQRKQVQMFVIQMERQLPSKAEIDTLLNDINKAAVERKLQFETFKPNAVIVREYYAELPIDLRMTGTYHDFAGFASDVANLSRIVTLGNLSFTPVKDGVLSISSVARTFRYLDPEEVKSQAPAPKAKK